MSKDKESADSPGPMAAGGIPTVKPSLLTMIMEIFGVSRAITIAAILFAVLVLTAAVFVFVESAPPRAITITSGPEGSIFHTNAVRYARILARYGVELNILTSEGSQENLNRLCDPAFRVDVGFVQGGITNEASGNLVSLGSISHQPLLVFYRGAPVELLSGLAGKRIAIGPVGSGTRALALILLGANGLKPGGATTLLDWEPKQASRSLLEGTIDAVFLMGEDASLAVISELMRAPDIHLLHFRQAAAYTRRYSYLSVIEFPQGVLDFGRNIPAQNVQVVGPTVELIARENLHPALSDLLLGAAREVHGRATLLQQKGEFPAPIEHDIRLSADAARYYKSGKGFFYRFLPFWLASLASRILVVFVPTIVVLIPVLRSIPYFYRWRIRTRIYRWYRALLALEKELFGEADPGKRQQLLLRLDEIEKAVNRMKVPAFFAD
ncbi:MAG: C4-dicarboxylate ABC transporter substrate-binding protein, partial [Verrucomicrobia bacterium]|nr:C4-dicarboxylate ABC transporter substrate-binding protein [Verrucomicrobiota bacterium]